MSMKTYFSPRTTIIEIGHPFIICTSSTQTSLCKKTPVKPQMNQKRQSYWEKYAQENPKKANDIQTLLNVDFSELSDKDVEEKIFALEAMAKETNKSFLEIRKYILDYFARQINESEYLYLLEGFDRDADVEARKHNIDKNNTFWIMAGLWILEKVKEIENRYSSNPPRSSMDSKELLLYFTLESDNDFLTLRKMHIYKNNYPMTHQTKAFVQDFHLAIDEYIERNIHEFLTNESNRNDTSLYKLALTSLLYRLHESLKQDCEESIEECNSHDVSYYTELDIAFEQAKEKYLTT